MRFIILLAMCWLSPSDQSAAKAPIPKERQPFQMYVIDYSPIAGLPQEQERLELKMTGTPTPEQRAKVRKDGGVRDEQNLKLSFGSVFTSKMTATELRDDVYERLKTTPFTVKKIGETRLLIHCEDLAITGQRPADQAFPAGCLPLWRGIRKESEATEDFKCRTCPRCTFSSQHSAVSFNTPSTTFASSGKMTCGSCSSSEVSFARNEGEFPWLMN
jgi:hypothetical protein